MHTILNNRMHFDAFKMFPNKYFGIELNRVCGEKAAVKHKSKYKHKHFSAPLTVEWVNLSLQWTQVENTNEQIGST